MTIQLPFTKMQGLGNDFVLLTSTIATSLNLHPDHHPKRLEKLAAFLCDRHFGIGADGLILPVPPTDPGRFDIRFVYLNSDGTWAEMCGNGIRCFARFLKDTGEMKKSRFVVETPAGPITPTINEDGTVTVDMGTPIMEAERIPFIPPSKTENPSKSGLNNTVLNVLGSSIPVTPVSMGNPHCIIFQNNQKDRLDPAVYGPAVELHPAFPAKTNVEFVDILSSDHLKVTVWERGCGFTLACGTGACATAVAAIQAGLTKNTVDIELPGGILNIQWDGNPQSPVLMRGPATTVFHGVIELSHELLA